jgi:glucan 1,3-beta-glucosidase
MSFDVLADFYVKGYNAVRESEYIAEGSHEVMVIIHDAFQVCLDIPALLTFILV